MESYAEKHCLKLWKKWKKTVYRISAYIQTWWAEDRKENKGDQDRNTLKESSLSSDKWRYGSISKDVDDLNVIVTYKWAFSLLSLWQNSYICLSKCATNIYCHIYQPKSGKRFSDLIPIKLASNYHFKVCLSKISIYSI